MERKHIVRTLYFICAILSAFLLPACNDGESLFLEIDDSVGEKVVSEIDGDVFIIPIHSNGSWTVALSDPTLNWLQVGKNNGYGDETVVLSVDPNFSGVGRDAVLNVRCGDVVRHINVHQNLMLNGEDIGNAEDYSVLVSNKGLGQGIDVSKQKQKGMVVNMKALRKLVGNYGPEYANLLSQSRHQELKGEIYEKDSVEAKHDTLKVGVHMELCYAVFKIDIDGTYEAGEFRKDSTMAMNVGVRYPMLVASADCPSIVAYFNEVQKSQQMGEEEQLLTTLFTKEFKDLRSEIDRECQENSDFTFNGKLESSLRTLLNKYGVAVTSETLLGGSMAMRMSVDTTYTAHQAGISEATVQANLNLGLFNVQLGVGASVIQETKEIVSHSAYYLKIIGGDRGAQSDVWQSLSGNDIESARSAINRWENSLVLSESGSENNAEVIDCHLFPLWMFFEGKSRKCVKDYIRSNYKDTTGILEAMMEKY